MPMTREVHLVTGNMQKVVWAREQCAPFGISVVHAPLELVEPQADTVAEVSLSKARQAFAKLAKPVVVEDGGLVIPALGGFPGPYSKYVLETIGIDGILKLMEDVEDRYAYYNNCVTFIDADGTEKQFVTTGYRGHIGTRVWPAGQQMWSAAWQIFVPLNFDRAMSTFSSEDWAECYRINEYKPVFTTFAEWYGAQAAAA